MISSIFFFISNINKIEIGIDVLHRNKLYVIYTPRKKLIQLKYLHITCIGYRSFSDERSSNDVSFLKHVFACNKRGPE